MDSPLGKDQTKDPNDKQGCLGPKVAGSGGASEHIKILLREFPNQPKEIVLEKWQKAERVHKMLLRLAPNAKLSLRQEQDLKESVKYQQGTNEEEQGKMKDAHSTSK